MLIVEMVHKGKGRWEGRGERYARAARARSMWSSRKKRDAESALEVTHDATHLGGAAGEAPRFGVEEVDVEALLREAEAADAAARATLPTPEQERVIIAAAEALAGSEEGVPEKAMRRLKIIAPPTSCPLHDSFIGWCEVVSGKTKVSR